MKILGIETSCDETAAAVVVDGRVMKSNVIASSMDLHAKYGGVVPEIAARSHIESIMPVINQALNDADCSWEEIDAIAVTQGAGLSGSLLIGVMTARTVAIVNNKPLYGINHVMGHVYANFITSTPLPGYTMPSKAPEFPLLAVIVSGGHTQLAFFDSHFNYRLLGKTQDDAIGEAFDKVAKILGLPYPGGPSVAEAAASGDENRYSLPIASMPNYDFSFSGLKTAVLRLAQFEIGERYDFPSIKLSERLSEAQKADIAASFQRVAVQTITNKVKRACAEFQPRSVVLAGGVAANQTLRAGLIKELAIPLLFPDIKLCTDNAAMIASIGYYRAMTNQPLADPYRLAIDPNLSM